MSSESVIRHTAFFLPVIRGELYLGMRGTEPHSGKWCAIGGKELGKYNPHWQFRLHDFVSDHDYNLLLSRVSDWTQEPMREAPAQTAIREFCEETHADKRYPHAFGPQEFTNVYTLGHIPDTFNGKTFHNFIVMGEVSRTDFALSARELRGLEPLRNIDPKDIVPITRSALRYMYDRQHYRPSFGETESEIKFNLSSPLRTTYRTLDVSIAEAFEPTTLIASQREIDIGVNPHPWTITKSPSRPYASDPFWAAYEKTCVEGAVRKERAELLRGQQ